MNPAKQLLINSTCAARDIESLVKRLTRLFVVAELPEQISSMDEVVASLRLESERLVEPVTLIKILKCFGEAFLVCE